MAQRRASFSRLSRALRVCAPLVALLLVAAPRLAHADEPAPTSAVVYVPSSTSTATPQPTVVDAPPTATEVYPERVTGGLELRYGVTPLFVGDSHFSGYGVDSTGSFRQIAANGRDIGVVNPTFHFMDFALTGTAGPAYGGMAIAYGQSGADQVPLDRATASQFDTGGVSFVRGSIEGGVGAWTGPFRWNVGLLLGVGGVRMDLTELHRRENCSKDCGGYASAIHGWIQPRASVEYLIDAGPNFGIGLGAYFGENLLNLRETEMGMTLSFRSVHDPT